MKLFIYLFTCTLHVFRNSCMYMNSREGYDERYIQSNPDFTTSNTEDIIKIVKYIDILEKINTLEKIPKTNGSVNQIWNKINDDEYNIFIVKNGGLFDDWNRTI